MICIQILCKTIKINGNYLKRDSAPGHLCSQGGIDWIFIRLCEK